ncbi:hypothetical protein FRB96_003725 [Tulasnella sp. 330]|nr:hypothetical protein FRB96_003725 [Tulasnella sp. 330]
MTSIVDIGWSYPNETQGTTRIYASIPPHDAPHSIQFDDFQGQAVEEKLNPPEMKVVKRALSMLVKSTEATNRMHLSKILVPINNIPLELFNNIVFLASLGDWGHLSHMDVVGTLAMISRRWAEVVFSTPQFWSTLEETMSQKQLVQSIERSKGIPLQIRFHQKDTSPLAELRREAFIATTVPHMHLWRSLDAHRIPWEVVEGVESNSPLLQKIEMDCVEMHSYRPIRLGEGVQIRHLDLTNIGIVPNPVRLRGLLHLSLDNLRGPHGPCLADLTLILSMSPELHVLSLVGLSIVLDPQDTSLDKTELFPPFHSLKRLQLRCISSRTYSYLLTRLCFPNCESIDLEPDPPIAAVDGDHHIPFRHDAPRFIQQIKNILICDKNPIQVALGDGYSSDMFSVCSFGKMEMETADANAVGFSLRIRAAHVLPAGGMGVLYTVEQVIELVEQSWPAAWPLHLSLNFNRYRSEYPIEYVGRFSLASVEKIAITGYGDAPLVLTFLARGQGSSEKLAPWVYPGLKMVDLSNFGDNNAVPDIRKAAKGRWTVFKDGGGGTSPEECVEVIMPKHKGGKKEIWKQVRKRNRK